MSPSELKRIIEQQQAVGSSFAILDLTKPKNFKLKGERVRTPFGLAEVYNVREYPDRIGITVRCELKNMIKVYEQINKLTPKSEASGE